MSKPTKIITLDGTESDGTLYVPLLSFATSLDPLPVKKNVEILFD